MGRTFGDTVTLYNAWDSDTRDGLIYYPTAFHNVEFQKSHGANVAKTGLESANSALLFIKAKDFPKEYKSPVEWANMNEEDRKKYFTANPYSNDFMVEGEFDAIVTELTLAPFFKSNYELFPVTNVDDWISRGHIEIGGK